MTVLVSAPATAQECPGDTEAEVDACINQDGDNETDTEVEGNLTGGDGVAGGQVIGGAGISGDVNIEANNDSEFANSDGGDAEAEIELDADSGPNIDIEGDTINVEANATGTAIVSQTANPNVSLTLSQFSNPTGEVFLTNTATSVNNQTGSSSITAGALAGTTIGDITVNQTINQTGSTPISNTVAPIVVFNPTQNNNNNASGNSIVSNTGTAIISNTANQTNTQNNSGGNSVISNTVSPTLNQNASNVADILNIDATGTSTITQTLEQSGSSSVTNTVAPVLTIDGSNTANISGSAPVSQTATAITNPTAIAIFEGLDKTTQITQSGDNETEFDPELNLAGGDGVAGSQVIGLAGVSGSVSIDASNSSRFATADGGDADIELDADVDSGPQISLGSNDINVEANATGVAIVSQTASPVVTIDVTQESTPSGSVTISNTASATNGGSLNQSIVAGSGAITQTITQSGTQSGSASTSNQVSPTLDIDGSNTADVTGSAPVNQTATATTNPTAVAVFGDEVGITAVSEVSS